MEKNPKLCCPTAHLENLLVLLIFICVFSSYFPCASCSLSFDFYAAACPSVELMVRNTVRRASDSDPSIPGKLLRLLFHDCFVEGCDASVLLEGNGTERSDPANVSLGGFSVIDAAKRVLEIFCPQTVSCADILALAARDSVQITGGPEIQIPMGRRDGRVSAASNVRPNIIDTSFSLDEMSKVFSSKGLSLDDLVTLSGIRQLQGRLIHAHGMENVAGAHTIGSAHCSAFMDRFKANPKGNFTLIDTSLDKGYANQLTKQCPAGARSSATINNDPQTPFQFDNSYFKVLLAHKGLFQSDSVLVQNRRTANKVEELANDQNRFFDSWAESFLKLSRVGVKIGDEGEIRQTCSTTNG